MLAFVSYWGLQRPQRVEAAEAGAMQRRRK
jgi:hypothetical protein